MNKKSVMIAVLAMLVLLSALTLLARPGESCRCWAEGGDYDCYRRCRSGGHGGCVACDLTHGYCLFGNVCLLRFIHQCEDDHISYHSYEVYCDTCRTGGGMGS